MYAQKYAHVHYKMHRLCKNINIAIVLSGRHKAAATSATWRYLEMGMGDFWGQLGKAVIVVVVTAVAKKVVEIVEEI